MCEVRIARPLTSHFRVDLLECPPPTAAMIKMPTMPTITAAHPMLRPRREVGTGLFATAGCAATCGCIGTQTLSVPVELAVR